mgnify:CR=1 FL=1
MLYVDINKLLVNIIMLHVDIMYACREQKHATMLQGFEVMSFSENIYKLFYKLVLRMDGSLFFNFMNKILFPSFYTIEEKIISIQIPSV